MDQARREILSYIAGYVDGEGCISMLGLETLKFGIVSGDRQVLELISSTFGGRVCPEHRKYHGEKRRYYRWRVNNRRAQEVLRELLPFPRAKLDAAERACQLEFVPRGKLATIEMREARRKFREFLVESQRVRLLAGSDKRTGC